MSVALQRKGIRQQRVHVDTQYLREMGACIYGPEHGGHNFATADEEYDWLRRQRAWNQATFRRAG